MTRPQVVLFANRAAGTGAVTERVAEIRAALAKASGCEVEVVLLSTHAQAREQAIARSQGRGGLAMVVAGGGGTLRAVVEGVIEAAGGVVPDAEAVRVAALRLGSGNVVAKRLGVPLYPVAGARAIGRNLRRERTSPGCVMRVTGTTVLHGLALCGLGQFGRVPGDLARWRRHTSVRRQVAGLVGLERLNNAEYGLTLAGRLLSAALYPPAAEMVAITSPGGKSSMRLLAGVAMNLPVAGLPDPEVDFGEAAIGVHLLAHPGLGRRLTTLRIQPGESLQLRLLDRRQVEYFLDEDPEQLRGRIKIEVAGLLSFVPGDG